MQRYLARRLLLFIPTLLLASLVIFAIMRVIPGDVAIVILGGGDEETPFTQEQLDSLRETLGLADPLPVQYGKWVWSLVNGKFGGKSIVDREPISEIIARRFPVTAQLALYTLVLAMVISLPLGVVAAIHQNRWPDYAARVFALASHSMPNFWVALMIILGLVVVFRWTPPLYYANLWENPSDHFQKVIWPVLILGLGWSSVVRVTRSNMLEVLRQDYVRTARSKGLVERVVIGRHALRNALIPVITVAGGHFESLMSGTVILESVFSVPGLGQGIVIAANTRDYPVIQSLALLLVFLTLSINLLVDIAYAFLDPRIRYS